MPLACAAISLVRMARKARPVRVAAMLSAARIMAAATATAR
jgi:hypothetical protein